MRTTLLLILSTIILASCETEEKSLSNNVVESSTNYVLKEDIRNSATNLNEGDTLNIEVNLSVCDWQKYSHLEIIKLNSEMLINVWTHDHMNDTVLSKTYPLVDFSLDSLLFTNLIDSLYQYQRNEIGYITRDGYGYEKPSGDITLSYKDDTIYLEDTLGLISKLEFIDKFNAIMLNEFPSMKIFKPLPKPNSVELDSTENNN